MQRIVVVAILGLAIVGAGCGGGTDRPQVTAHDSVPDDPSEADTAPEDPSEDDSAREDPAGDEPVSTPASPNVEVVADIAYYRTSTEGARHLDVYHPGGGEDLPLVVVFHPNPVFGADKASVADLATRVAQRGAVVIAPTYGGRAFDPVEVLRWFRDEGPCAVWQAVAMGPSFGADPSQLILVGDVTGILPAQMTTFSPPAEIDDCDAHAVDLSITSTILFETDWLFLPDFWDEVFVTNPGYFEAITHWDDIADPPPTRIHFLAGEMEAHNTTRSLNGESYSDSDWVGIRDPERRLAGAFAESGVLDDGVMSFQDVAMVTVDVLTAAGWNADFTIVPGVAHSMSTPESRELVVDLVFAGLGG